MSNNVEELVGFSTEKMRALVDADTVVGTPLTVAEGITVIPVSKIAYGFASGGTDLRAKKPEQNDGFGGAGGAGVNITPVAFLVVQNGSINVLPIVAKPDAADRAISMVPDVVNKITDAFGKK